MQIGQRVRVRGLVNKPHFNGMEGTIINTLYSQKGFCWVYHVKLDKGGKKLLFKDSNIEVIGVPQPTNMGNELGMMGYEDETTSTRVAGATNGFGANVQAHGIQTRTARAQTFSAGHAKQQDRTYRDSYFGALGLPPNQAGTPHQRVMSRGRNLSFDGADQSNMRPTIPTVSINRRQNSMSRYNQPSLSPPANGARQNMMMSPRIAQLQREYSKPISKPGAGGGPTPAYGGVTSTKPSAHARNSTISGNTGNYLATLGF